MTEARAEVEGGAGAFLEKVMACAQFRGRKGNGLLEEWKGQCGWSLEREEGKWGGWREAGADHREA